MKIGQFILIPGGRIGIVTTKPTHGQCDLWFGNISIANGRPVIERLLVRSDWQTWTYLESDVEILVHRNQHGVDCLNGTCPSE